MSTQKLCRAAFIFGLLLPSLALGQAATRVRLNADAVFARKVSVQLREAPLAAALDEISRRADVPILYSRDLLPADIRVSIDAADMPLDALLGKVLANTGRRARLSAQNEILLVAATPAPSARQQEGTIVGRVVDSSTGRPVPGALVVIEGMQRRALTDNQGVYRFSKVPAGEHRLTVRHIGFAEISRTVGVSSAGSSVTQDFPLAVSAVLIDQLVVTGTVVETSVREIPNPISIITAADIEREGVRTVNDLLRGQVPGVVSPDNGQGSEPNGGGRGVYVRGSATIAGSAGSNSIKTYIDGIEVANPRMIQSIDPAMIERIEILRGPQASTLYGSGALNGVMQIFMKKGVPGTRPKVTLDVSGGFIESSHSNNLAPQTDVVLSVTGGTADLSYNAGASKRYEGDWTPDWYLDSRSLFAGLRLRQGRVTADLSGRFSDREVSMGRNPVVLERIRRGEYAFTPAGVVPYYNDYENQAQTLGLTLKFDATPNWQHRLTAGQDVAKNDGGRAFPTYYSVTDTLTGRFRVINERTSIAYNTTAVLALTNALKGTFTVGYDRWDRKQDSHFVGQTVLTHIDDWNRGVFGQAHLGFNESVFLTAGVRAEDNPNFGDEIGWNIAPRVGLAFVRQRGDMTFKLRASAGTATRPPSFAQKDQSLITPTQLHIANPELGPEFQSGIDGGFEIYFNPRTSVELTRYNQTVDDLIYEVYTYENLTQPNPEGYVRVRQHQNLGDVRNRGWEAMARTARGPLEFRTTFSTIDSRIKSIKEGFRGTEKPGDRLLGVARTTGSAAVSYSDVKRNAAVMFNYLGNSRLVDTRAYETARRARLQTVPPVESDFITNDYPATTRLNVSASQRIWRAQIWMRIDNLLDSYGNDVNNDNPARGRLSTLGVRFTF